MEIKICIQFKKKSRRRVFTRSITDIEISLKERWMRKFMDSLLIKFLELLMIEIKLIQAKMEI